MGTYRYTARAGVRRVDGKEMAEFKYAYKPWNGWNAPAGFDATCARYDAMGHKAAAKLNDRGVTLVVLGGFPKSEGVYSHIHRVEAGRIPSGYYDTASGPGELVGYLAKVNGRFRVYEDRFDLANAIGPNRV